MNYFFSVPGVINNVLMVIGAGFAGRTAARFLPLHKNRLRAALLYLVLAATLINLSWIGDENPLILFPFFIAAFLLGFEGPWYARLVMGAIFYTLLEPLCMMVDSFERIFVEDIFHLRDNYYYVYAVLVKTVVMALVWLLFRRIAPQGGALGLPPRLWGLLGMLCIGPLFSVLTFTLWNAKFFDDYGAFLDIAHRLAYTVLPFTMLSALALLVAATVLSRHQALEEAKRLADLQAVYYQSLQREQTGVRTLRHDLRNHIAAAGGLLAGGKPEEAKRYLEELAAAPALAASVRFCDNEVANAVLGDKAAAMERQGLTPAFEVALPAALPLADTDLCALLGNALDNAIEAASGAADKTILLRARADRGALMLRVENALAGPVRQKDGVFQTTKADKSAHGFGIAGMREIARRQGGTLEAAAKNGRFELVVYLPLGGPVDSA